MKSFSVEILALIFTQILEKGNLASSELQADIKTTTAFNLLKTVLIILDETFSLHIKQWKEQEFYRVWMLMNNAPLLNI